VTTQNYTEPGYNKLIAAANFIKIPTTDSTILGKDNVLLPLTANLFAGTLSHDGAGVLHYELADEDNFFYPRNENSEVSAQDTDIKFLIDQDNFVDSDGIGITEPQHILDTTGINLRFGRALIENSFGPETSHLPQKLSTQYLNASGRYVANEEDSCTPYDASKIILTSGTLNKDLTGVNTVAGQLAGGKTRAMILTTPGAGKQGSIKVEYKIYDWLKYYWDWNGVNAKEYNQNPTATATFGLFRGNDRIIYQREIFY
jgi:MSHA biogenesis protein MshQ